MHWNGDWHMGWMGLWWILIIAAVVAAGFWFAMSTSRRSGDSEESPERLLKRRYAKGEIDRETYERMLADLHR